LIVIPPMRFAGHEMVAPRRVILIGAPETATRTLVGATASVTVIVEPRCTTIGFPDAEIGAPHFAPQHHDETARRTCPGSPKAAGGFTARRVKIRAVSTGPT
jgi:hypothetical protein